MAKTKQWAMDEADTTIDYAIQEVRNGFDREKAIEILMRNDNVMNFYSRDDLEMIFEFELSDAVRNYDCLLYTSPSPRDGLLSRMPSSA